MYVYIISHSFDNKYKQTDKHSKIYVTLTAHKKAHAFFLFFFLLFALPRPRPKVLTNNLRNLCTEKRFVSVLHITGQNLVGPYVILMRSAHTYVHTDTHTHTLQKCLHFLKNCHIKQLSLCINSEREMKPANWCYVSITARALTALTSTFNSESTVSTNSPTPTHTSMQCTAAQQ